MVSRQWSVVFGQLTPCWPRTLIAEQDPSALEKSRGRRRGQVNGNGIFQDCNSSEIARYRGLLPCREKRRVRPAAQGLPACEPPSTASP